MDSAQKTPLRAVLAGCGSISKAWLKPIADIAGLEMVGLVDVVEANARQRAAEFGLERAEIGASLVRVLENTRPNVVFDCTTPAAHVDVTLAALAHGCHVLGEKPLADSMAHARQMVAAAQSAGRLYAVMQNRRFLPEIRAVRDYIQTGEIGALTNINSDFFIAPHFGGFRDEMEHVLLMEMAIHTFDQARFLSGAEAVSVYCKEWNPSGSWYAHDASAVAIFEMSGGLVYTYRGSWCAEGLPTSWESDWRIVGLRGTVLWDGEKGMAAEITTGPGGFYAEHRPGMIQPYSGEKVGGHGGLIRDFVDCLRTGRTPDTICTDNIKSLAMVFAAIESAESGRPVEVQAE